MYVCMYVQESKSTSLGPSTKVNDKDLRRQAMEATITILDDQDYI